MTAQRSFPTSTRTGQLTAGLDAHVRSKGVEAGKRLELLIDAEPVGVSPDLAAGVRRALLALIDDICASGVESDTERRLAGKPVTAVLKLVVKRDADGLTVELSDDGRGEDVSPGRRTLAPGLAAAAREARAFHGALTVDRRAGAGSTFRLALPLTEAAAAA